MVCFRPRLLPTTGFCFFAEAGRRPRTWPHRCCPSCPLSTARSGPLVMLPSASATDFDNGYHPDETIDGATDVPWNGWSARAGESTWSMPLKRPTAISRIVVHTQKDYELRDYTIAIQCGEEWKSVAEVKGNTDIRREHTVSADKVRAVRVYGLLGPERQPGIVRVTELQVFQRP